MRIGVLGTGTVGSTIGSALLRVGHEVCMGSRTATNEKAAEWAVSATGEHLRGKATHGSFADAARFGEILFNCTAGVASLDALEAAGRDNLRAKILVELANPLDFSKGRPPSLSISNTDSLGERIQSAYPELRVVKTLNTVNCFVMVDPSRVPGDHVLFLSGNDAAAKRTVADRLSEWFGWKPTNILDLGDITTARGAEMYLSLWIRTMFALGTADFNINVVRAPSAAANAAEGAAVATEAA